MSLSEQWESLDRHLPNLVSKYRVRPIRWFLLEGSRHHVTLALLLTVYGTIFAIGSLWTLEIQQLLTETAAVQTLLNTMLGGVILLVSIVASISAIVLSYDITSLDAQEERIDAAMEFRRDVGKLASQEGSPTDPASFLDLMAGVIRERADALESASRDSDKEFADAILGYTQDVARTVDGINRSMDRVGRGEFAALWRGLEVEYGDHLNRSRKLTLAYDEQFTDDSRARFDELVRAFELFATGKEYFKTLYYSREISQLSRTLLLISFPSILVTASAILAIDAHLFPQVWLFGLPPLLSFVSAVFTVSLAPFAVLTSYMLRVATVARRTASAGPFRIA